MAIELSKPKYQINERVRFIYDSKPYYSTSAEYSIARGDVIDSHFDSIKGEWVYIIDPWNAGYAGHKKHNIPESAINPSFDAIEALTEKASITLCKYDMDGDSAHRNRKNEIENKDFREIIVNGYRVIRASDENAIHKAIQKADEEAKNIAHWKDAEGREAVINSFAVVRKVEP